MGTHVVEAPSGLVVELRTFKVKDADLLGDKKNQRDGNAGSKLLEIITTRVHDAGPYKIESADRVTWREWQKVLQGDRMVLLSENRRLTNPDTPIEWSTQCRNKRCAEMVHLDIPLEKFAVKPLPEASRAHVMHGHPLIATLPLAGNKVSFRLLRGEDDKGLRSIKREHGDKLSTKLLRFRTVDIEGVPAKDWENWLADLDQPDQAYLLHQFDQADCGLENEQEVGCNECGFTWKEDVTFDDDFLFPKYRQKNSSGT